MAKSDSFIPLDNREGFRVAVYKALAESLPERRSLTLADVVMKPIRNGREKYPAQHCTARVDGKVLIAVKHDSAIRVDIEEGGLEKAAYKFATDLIAHGYDSSE